MINDQEKKAKNEDEDPEQEACAAWVQHQEDYTHPDNESAFALSSYGGGVPK